MATSRRITHIQKQWCIWLDDINNKQRLLSLKKLLSRLNHSCTFSSRCLLLQAGEVEVSTLVESGWRSRCDQCGLKKKMVGAGPHWKDFRQSPVVVVNLAMTVLKFVPIAGQSFLCGSNQGVQLFQEWGGSRLLPPSPFHPSSPSPLPPPLPPPPPPSLPPSSSLPPFPSSPPPPNNLDDVQKQASGIVVSSSRLLAIQWKRWPLCCGAS